MAKEIRIVFNDEELYLYNYVMQKSGSRHFIKNLIMLEQKRENNYINYDVALDEKIKEYLKFFNINHIPGPTDPGPKDPEFSYKEIKIDYDEDEF